MTACSAINCTNRSERGFKMKRVPQDPALQKIYKSKTKRNKIKEHAWFCEVHFDADQWVEIGNRRLLKKSAIPTIFRDTSSTKVKSPGKRNTTMEVELNSNAERNASMSNSHNSDVSMPTLKPEGKFNKRTKWSNEENENLIRLVQFYGINEWEKISKCFTRRTDLQCKVRWQKLSNLRLVKKVLRPWTKEEDDKLKELVEKYGAEKWNFIAHHLDKRIGRHCKERWNNIVNPANSKREQKNTKVSWSVQERKLLFYYHNLWGNQWSRIAEHIGTGRTDNAVKSYWNFAHKNTVKPVQGRLKPGRPKKKFINESSSTMPKSKYQESLQTSYSKPAVGPKRRGRKPKNMLILQEGLPEKSALRDFETVDTNSESKNVRVLLDKHAVGSSEHVPSATTVMSENANSSSISENVSAISAIEDVPQRYYDAEDISNKRKENIVVQSPSSRNPYQFSVKTPQDYPNKYIHMKPNIHLDVPSTTSAIPENSDSSSTFASMSADGVLKQDLRRTELQNTENGVENSISIKKKIVTVQSPSSKNLYQFPAKTTENSYNEACVKCMKHSIHSKDVPSGPATENSSSTSTNENFHANTVLNPGLSREKLQSVENMTSKRTKSVIAQSPSSKNPSRILARTPQNPTAQEIPVDVNNHMDDIIIVNVHSLNADKSFQIKSADEESLPCMLPEDTENNCNSCLPSKDPEDSAEKISSESHREETSVNAFVGQMSESRPALLKNNQIISESPLMEAEDSSDRSSPLQDLYYGKLQTSVSNNQAMKQSDFSCSSAEADRSSPVTDIMEEVSIDQPQCSSQAHNSLFCQKLQLEMLQENGHVNSRFVETSQTSNVLPSTSLKNTFLKRKKYQIRAQTSTTANCSNETSAGSSQSQCFHTSKDLIPETLSDNQFVSQNGFENRISNFFNRMQAARHTYEMVCGNILREFEKLVSEAAVSDSSDLGPFSFMKPFLDNHQPNSRSFNSLEFMKLFFMFFGDKIDTGRIKEPVPTDSNKMCCCINRMQQCTGSRRQSNSSVEMDASRCGGPHEQETEILNQSASEEHPRKFKKKRKTAYTMKKTRME